VKKGGGGEGYRDVREGGDEDAVGRTLSKQPVFPRLLSVGGGEKVGRGGEERKEKVVTIVNLI